MNSLKEGAMWRIDPLMGRDLEANNRTTAVAVQRRGKHISTTMKLLLGIHVPAATGETGCCLRVPRRGIIKKRTGATKSFEFYKGG
jgi:hypothetical protein